MHTRTQRFALDSRTPTTKTMTTMTIFDPARRGRWKRAGTALLALALVVPLGACDFDSLLDVEAPDQIPADGLAVPANAELLVDGAVGDFECAYGAYVTLTAVMAGEMTDATQTASRWPYDQRNVNSNDTQYSTSGCTGLGVYTPVSQARWSADNILEHLEEWSDAEVEGRQALIARAAVFSGYSHLLLAEGFCSVAIDMSAEMQSSDVLQRAVTRLERALAAATGAGESDVANLARVGLARAHIDLGNTTEALGYAQDVPPGFEYTVTASAESSRRNNRVFAQNGLGSSGGSALSVGERYRNVTWAGDPDPRVPVVDEERNATDGTPIFTQTKYESLSAPIPLATADEAQLIIAEIEGGQTAVDIINAFHAAAGLDPFGGGSAAEILDHVIEERSRELWLEGHRFHDIRRFDLPLVPEPGTPHRKGSTYGDDRCFPLPDVERRNNPNIT